MTGLRAPLQTLLRLHYRYRFDPEGLSGIRSARDLQERGEGMFEQTNWRGLNRCPRDRIGS